MGGTVLVEEGIAKVPDEPSSEQVVPAPRLVVRASA